MQRISGWLKKQGLKTHAQHLGGGYGTLRLLKTDPRHPWLWLARRFLRGNPAGFLLPPWTGKRFYLACDTGLFGDMRLIGEEGIDLAILPIR